MQNAEFFLKRNLDSIMAQTFKDYEIVLTKDGGMAENTNSGIKRARGEYIKILYLDDYFSNQKSLEQMMSNLAESPREWVMCGTDDNPEPQWTDDIETGNNKLGSPSALIFKNSFENNLLFDERMSWLLDCDFYVRMTYAYGPPFLYFGKYITLGKGDHQMTHILTDEEKLKEHDLMKNKYA